jgi:hypothetical protein
VFSAAVNGIEAFPVEAEVNAGWAIQTASISTVVKSLKSFLSSVSNFLAPDFSAATACKKIVDASATDSFFPRLFQRLQNVGGGQVLKVEVPGEIGDCFRRFVRTQAERQIAAREG